MAEKVVWMSKAKEDYREIISYLLDKWSFEVADRFTTQIDDVIELLKVHHYLGAVSGRLTSLTKITIQPHYTLYYLFVEDMICVVNILDNRQKPQLI